MDRRKFITQSAAMLSVVSTQTTNRLNHTVDRETSPGRDDHNKRSTDDSAWCIEYQQPDADSAGLQKPKRDPSFTVTGTKDVEVYWVSDDVINNAGFPFAKAVANVGGELIWLNKDRSEWIDQFVLLHELAHSLGYRHGDGGIVNQKVALDETAGDRSQSSNELDESTVDVAQSFDGYEHVTEWDIGWLGTLGSDFAAGHTGIETLGTTGQYFAGANSPEDMYIEHAHDGFGDVYTDQYQSNPDHNFRGHYYRGD